MVKKTPETVNARLAEAVFCTQAGADGFHPAYLAVHSIVFAIP